MPVKCDIRNEEEVISAVESAVKTFGGIDILINNASAINLSPISILPSKQFDLMQNINSRGVFLVSQKCIPHLKKSSNGHILTLSPPLSLDKKWFSHFAPYTLSKFGMSMLTLEPNVLVTVACPLLSRSCSTRVTASTDSSSNSLTLTGIGAVE